MDLHELVLAVRNTYSDAMKGNHTTEAAIRRCVAIAREHNNGHQESERHDGHRTCAHHP
jgi:hypothetical protein